MQPRARGHSSDTSWIISHPHQYVHYLSSLCYRPHICEDLCLHCGIVTICLCRNYFVCVCVCVRVFGDLDCCSQLDGQITQVLGDLQRTETKQIQLKYAVLYSIVY